MGLGCSSPTCPQALASLNSSPLPQASEVEQSAQGNAATGLLSGLPAPHAPPEPPNMRPHYLLVARLRYVRPTGTRYLAQILIGSSKESFPAPQPCKTKWQV